MEEPKKVLVERSVIRNPWQSNLVEKLRIKNELIRGFFAEFLATFVLVVLVESSAATSIFVKPNIPKDILMSCIVQGASVAFAIYVSGACTGGFLNPAVTFVWALLGRMKWTTCIVYCIAQYAGAFVASIVAYFAYYDLFSDAIQPSPHPELAHVERIHPHGFERIVDPKTAFGTYPRDGLSLTGAWIDQLTCSALLLIGVMAISDRRNWRPSDGLFPISIGLVVMIVNLGFSFNAGAAMNPARDFSPRLFSYLVGMGDCTFTTLGSQWFLVPVFGSHIGAVIGALVYLFLVEIHWPSENPTYFVQNLAVSGIELLSAKQIPPTENGEKTDMHV